MSKQEEFDLGTGFDRRPKVYTSGPYMAHHYAGEPTANVYHKSAPDQVVDTISTQVPGGPQAELNKWHASIRKGTR